MMQPDSPRNSRCLKVALIGQPNCGKSSLVNMLSKWNVCATAGKVNTTRTKQSVVFNQGDTQLVFVDLPGIVGKEKARNHKLEKSIIRDPYVGIFESDLIICIADVTHLRSKIRLDLELLKALHFFKEKPSILVLNKVDKSGKFRRVAPPSADDDATTRDDATGELQRRRMGGGIELFDMVRRLTRGVVGGRISHTDKYANRLRHQLARPIDELLADPRTQQLTRRHLAQRDQQVQQLRHQNESGDDVIMLESGQKAEHIYNKYEVESGGGDDDDDDIESDSAVTQSYATTTTTNEVALEAAGDEDNVTSLLLQQEGEGGVAQHDEQLDAVLQILRKQLMMCEASKEEVTQRLRKWRAITAHLEMHDEKDWPHFQEVFACSSLTGQGIPALRDYLISQAKPGLWHFHSSLITDLEPEALVEMALRAAMLSYLQQEVPYNVRIQLEGFERAPPIAAECAAESAGGDCAIRQPQQLFVMAALCCNSERHLKRVIGLRGGKIRQIADRARLSLEKCFQTHVSLKVVARLERVPSDHLRSIKRTADFSKSFPNIALDKPHYF